MKYSVNLLPQKKSLPIALALAIGVTGTLTGCMGDQMGDTNSGSTEAGTSSGISSPLIVLGGLLGVAAVMDSGSSDTGIVVNTAGNNAVSGNQPDTGSDNGTGNTNNGNNDNGTGNTNNSTNDSGTGNTNNGTNDNGTGNTNNSTNDNGTGNTNNGTNDNGTGNTNNGTNDSESGIIRSDATIVEFLDPPAWLRGMWRGTDSNGIARAGFATDRHMGTGITGQTLNGYADIPEVCIHLLEKSDAMLKYTIWYPQADGTEVLFNEQWVNNGDGSVLYTISGDVENEFVMHRTPATHFLRPPQWLQGRWEGDQKVAQINDGNIVYGDKNSTRVDYYQLANQPGSVFQVLQNDASKYAYKVTSTNAQGRKVIVNDSFKSTGNNTVTFTGSDYNNVPASLVRQ